MVMPARASAWRDASTGPRPMISGDSPETPVDTTRASGVSPSSLALVSLMTTTAAAPSLSGQQLPAVIGALLAEHRVEALQRLERHAGARAVVLADHGAVAQRHRGDLALEEAVGDGLLGAVLRRDAPLVLALTGDAAQGGDVLGGLAHRQVDVGQQALLARVGPGLVALGDLLAAGGGPGELGVLVVTGGATGAGPVGVLRDALDATGDEDVALAGLDRVVGHPRGLHGRGAEPVDRRARQPVEAGEHGDDARHVGPVLARRLGAAPVEVLDQGRVELGDLGQRGARSPARTGRRGGCP